jgi:hypothetical protein
LFGVGRGVPDKQTPNNATQELIRQDHGRIGFVTTIEDVPATSGGFSDTATRSARPASPSTVRWSLRCWR